MRRSIEVKSDKRRELHPIERMGDSIEHIPMIVTPLYEYDSPGFVATQFPPASAAKSTITDPGLRAAIIYEIDR